MSNKGYHRPGVFAIIFGILAAFILLIMILSLADVVKWIGAAFLFIPDQLGMVDTVKRSEVYEIDLSAEERILPVETPGKYAVFTSDYDLLTIAQALGDTNSSSTWLKLIDPATGDVQALQSISRGLRPYDTPLAEGRPIFIFEVEKPVTFDITASRRPASIFVVPDYTTGKEPLIIFAYILELAIIVIVLGMIIGRKKRAANQKIKEVKNLKHIQGNDFWKETYQKQKEKEKDL
jgi:hypothetical protein